MWRQKDKAFRARLVAGRLWKMRKINILLCDTFPGLLPAYIPSYESMFMRLLDAAAGEPLAYEVVETWRGVLPGSIRTDELYLVTGSNSGVYEPVPWIRALLQWIREAVAGGARLLGVCFGHQAIAQALGGGVERHAGGWGAGVREATVLDDGLRRFLPGEGMHLLYNHHDQVVRLPPDARLLATSAFCRHEAFGVGGRVLAFQGHPEYVPEYALHLLLNHAQGEPEAVVAAAVRSIAARPHDGLAVARYALDFLARG